MIDLHIHTLYSDGDKTVEEILKMCEEKHMEYISITDHNSIEAYYELEGNEKLRKIFSGEIILGSELKTTYNKVNIEVISKLMGHANITITYNKYIHSIKEEEAKAMNMIKVC